MRGRNRERVEFRVTQIIIQGTAELRTDGTMTRVQHVEPEAVDDPELDELFAQIEELEGQIPNHFRAELNFPEYIATKLRSTMVLWQEGDLSMPEIQHVGIAVSQANGCEYCTGAFCTILDYGLEADREYVQTFLRDGLDAVDDDRLRTILEYALTINDDPDAVSDEDIERLREVGLSDGGIVQLTHLVSDFASYNRINTALDTDYDYEDLWREVGFDDLEPNT